MLSALKNCTLKSCITTISARNNTVVRSVAPSKPAGGFAKKSLAASARTRLFCTSRFEEGDNDREEQAFTYFYRKIRIGDEPEEPKAKKATKSSTRVVLPSTKQVAAKPVVKSSVASETTTKRVTSEDAGSRLDRFVTRLFPKLPHSRIQKLLRDKKITVKHPGAETFKKVEANERLQEGTIVRLRGTIDILNNSKHVRGSNGDEKPVLSLSREKVEEVRSWVIHKDDNIIVVNKPANLAVQKGSKISDSMDGLCAALKYEKEVTPKLVHRLDRGASGLLILARDRPTAQVLTKQFQGQNVQKLYWALCINVPKRLAGTVRVGLRKENSSDEDSERVVVVDTLNSVGDEEADSSSKDSSIKMSSTRYHTIAHTYKSMSLLALRPKTGRTHQLRVHCSSVLRTPILGDYKYGPGLPEHLQELLADENQKSSKNDFESDSSKTSTREKPSPIAYELEKVRSGLNLHLHAREIAFEHPATKKPVHYVAPVPPHFMQTMRHFEYNLMTGDSPYSSLSAEERKLTPVEFTFKEGKLKQKLRLNKLQKTDEWKRERRRDFAMREKLQNAPKRDRPRLNKLKKEGQLTLKSFKPKPKPKYTAKTKSRNNSRGSKRPSRR